MNIEIDKSPFSTDYWYSGKIYQNEIEYEFTLLNGDNLDSITWINETPDNSEKLEKEIIEQFKSR